MIKRIVDRCHVHESYETVIRYVISKMELGFVTYRTMNTKDKALVIETIMDAHKQNREQYYFVMGGLK